MNVHFRGIDLPSESETLVTWLCAETWPFHSNSVLTVERVREWIASGLFGGTNHRAFWIFRGSDERVGLIRLFDLDDIPDGTPMFDLRLRGSARGLGVGSQAVRWLTSYCFETWPELHRIEANTRADNIGMRRVFTKCLYSKEAHVRKAWRSANGDRFDTIYYGILREDWLSGRITPVNWNDEPNPV